MRSKILLLVGIAIFFIWGCNEAPQESSFHVRKNELIKAAGGRYYGKTIKLRESDYYRSLDPHNVVSVVGSRMANQIYEGLVKFNDEDLSLEPNLAQRWEIDQSGKVYTFYLRKGINFQHNKCFGRKLTRELTAKDVEYCFTRLCEYREDNQLFFTIEGLIKGGNEYFESTKKGTPLEEKVTGIKVIDDYTIRITLNIASDQFLYSLSSSAGFIFPKEAIDYYEKGFGQSPVGTGPFYLAEFQANKYVFLKRNPHYWGKDSFNNQLPYLDGIHISFLNKKLDEIVAFREGKLDILYTIPVQYINQLVGNIEAAKEGKNSPFKIQTTQQMGTEFLGFNHLTEPFNNALVRKAFAYAIDKDQLTFYDLKGDGIPAKYGFVPSCLPLYPFNLVSGSSLDVEKARALLAEAGYPNGEGFPELKLYYNPSDKINSVVAGVKKMLEANLNIKIIPFETENIDEHLKMINSGEAKFWRLSWFSDYPNPQNHLVQFYSGLSCQSKNYIDYPKINRSYYHNPKYDSLFLACSKEPDLNKKMQLFSKADQLLMDESVIIPLYYNEAIRLIAPTIENFPINPMEMRDFTEVYFRPQNTKELLVITNK